MSKPARRRTNHSEDVYLKKNWPLACAFLGRIRNAQKHVVRLEAQLENQRLLYGKPPG